VPYGWARVYYATGQDHLTRPVILADGFGFGASDPDELWHGLENKAFPFISRAGNGEPTDALAGGLALSTENPDGLSTKMWLQDNGAKFHAGWYKLGILPAYNFYTDNLPKADSAPGGTLDSFGIAAENLRQLGYQVQCDYPTINFVPSVSAVAIRDIGTDDDLYLDIDREPVSARRSSARSSPRIGQVSEDAGRDRRLTCPDGDRVVLLGGYGHPSGPSMSLMATNIRVHRIEQVGAFIRRWTDART
jgi:hypothetical protein